MRESFAYAGREAALPVAVAMLPGRKYRKAVASATCDLLRMEFCEEADEAEQLVIDHHAVALFTRHEDVNGVRACDMIGHVRDRLPHLPIVMLEPWKASQFAPCDTCAAGADAVWRARRGQLVRRVDALVKREMHRARRAEVAERVAQLVTGAVRGAVQSAIEHGDRPRRVYELAASIGVRRKTLDRRLFRASAPSAEQLIAWGRLVAAAMFLQRGESSIGGVTRELHFASPCAFRNLLKRYAGLTPSQLREPGGADHLFARLHDAMTGRCAASLSGATPGVASQEGEAPELS